MLNTYMIITTLLQDLFICEDKRFAVILQHKQYNIIRNNGKQTEYAKRHTRFFAAGDAATQLYIRYHTRSLQVVRLSPDRDTRLETLGTLMGKYGEEGDKLLFKILNSGDFLSGMDREELVGEEPLRVAARICDKGLRYDLTVPFARYVVQHRDEIKLPFKRYQIQPVWRADRPQKGRYREFYQCDADVVGSDSLLNEVELLQMVDMVFRRLNVRVVIKLNNRKILAGIAELI